MFQFLMELDKDILIWIQNTLRNDILTPIFVFITKLGDLEIIWILISLISLIPKKLRVVGIIMLFSLGTTFLINNILLKNLVERIRPYEAIYGLERLIEQQNSFSFPSGHTAGSFSAAIILLLNLPKKYGIAAIVLAILISFSRLYLGVHYLTDILCGAIIGTMIAFIVYSIYVFLFGINR